MSASTKVGPQGEARGGRVCRRLRWKGMFIDAEPDPLVPNTRDGLCWCARTQRSLGPDGGVVEAEKCIAGRQCWEGLG